MCIRDRDLKEFAIQMMTMMNSLNKSMKNFNEKLLQSLSSSHKNIIEDKNGFPIWVPDENAENISHNNEITLNDSH